MQNVFYTLDFDLQQEPGKISLTLPIRTYSEANGGNKKVIKSFGKKIYKNEHWWEQSKRHKCQKFWVSYAFNKPEMSLVQPPCTITMIRYATKFLDEDDNLRMALKPLKDYLASHIMNDFCPGRADGNRQLKWKYDQVKSDLYAVKVIIEFEGPLAVQS